MCSYVNFFKIFIKNPFLSCPYLIKKINYIKTTLYYEPKKSIGCPFFPISHGKIIALMPKFCKYTYSPKSTLLSSLDFVKKTAILSKTLCSYVIFSNFHDKPPAVKTLFGHKNVNTVKITL